MKLKKLTQDQKEQLLDMIESEGLEYYFLDHTAVSEELAGTEMEPLAKAFEEAGEALRAKLDEYEAALKK